MNANPVRLAEVKSIGTDVCAAVVANHLRELANDVEAGRIKANSAILCFTDMEGSSMGFRRVGGPMFMTQWIGLLEAIKMALFRESNP